MIRWFAIGAVVLLVLAGSGAAYQGLRYMNQSLAIEEPVLYELVAGTPFSLLVKDLKQRGWLESALAMRLHARLDESATRVQAGQYLLEPGITAPQLLQKMVAGDVHLLSLTIVEGWRFSDMKARLMAEAGLKQDVDWAKPLWPQLGIDKPLADNPEGQFYPDTYRFPEGQAVSRLLRQSYERLRQVLDQAWAKRRSDLPLKSPYEALILASIVEKETGQAAERPQIAGVFVRRLERGMRLQTDPTIIYGLGQNFDGNLRRRHLKDSTNPYNSYRHHGLPPSPIALVGRAAIEAAVQPKDGDSLYFVARGDGSHYFSATLAEHEAAVRKFQIEKRRSDYRSAPK